MRLVFITLATLGLTACVSTGSPRIDSRAEPAIELARLLEETAQRHPERIEASSAQIGALRAALLESPQAMVMAPAPVMTHGPEHFAPAPDLDDAQSLLYAAHLASYRRMEHVETGWRQLGAQLPALTGMQARTELVHLEQGDFLRLKAGPFDTRAEAQALCAQAQTAGLWCQATHFTGQAVPG